MPKARYAQRIEGHAEQSTRPKMRGTEQVCLEQQCPSCHRYMPRFKGSEMRDGSRSTFEVCSECRGVERVV